MAEQAQPGRIDLGDGDWAEIVQRPAHGAINRLYKAFVAANKDEALYLDLMTEAILSLTSEWSIRLPDGNVAPLTREGVEAAPWEKTKPVFDAAMVVFNATKGTGPNS